jgi:hypothetical protein
MESFEDDHISKEACEPRADEAESHAATEASVGALLLRLPPALARPLVLVVALVGSGAVVWSSAAVTAGAAQLVRLRPWWVLVPSLALVLALGLLSVRWRGERWRGTALDRLTLQAPLGAALTALGACVWRPECVLLAWLASAAAAGHLLPWPWSRRTERAWLLHRPGYTRGLLAGTLLLGLVGPIALALGLRALAPRLEARVETLERGLDQGGPDCLARLHAVLPGDAVDRLALLAFGARARGRLGEGLARCLAPELEESETLAQRVQFDSGQLCEPAKSGHNRDLFAAWFGRRERLARAAWLVAAFTPQAQAEYAAALQAQAGAAAACGDPLLVPQARLFAAADPLGALQGCGESFARAPHDDWVRAALDGMRALGQPAAFTGPAFPLGGRGWAERRRERPGPDGMVITRPVEAVLLRPRPDERDFDVALHVRWLRADEAGERFNPWMEEHQRGHELYLIECAPLPKPAERLDALRDSWGLADRRLMGSRACPRAFSATIQHHVLPFAGGRQFLVARHRGLNEISAETRLVYTERDPCPR